MNLIKFVHLQNSVDFHPLDEGIVDANPVIFDVETCQTMELR